ncbi:hypothetical protein EST38_g6147 [Candolleomyces aberdarensis]|uniref:Peptidase A1 domain-containing protein n=1 Tax=Candolleomyces aberdarensis TaxID=2316362 RepID=A0A4Q2DKK9_9AGAR|nr:hypothetical protein EST38_g6147 [Candolleomyces aberdarensis]
MPFKIPLVLSAAFASIGLHGVSALQLQFNRRALNAHASSPLTADFHGLFSSSLGTSDGKDANSISNVQDVRYTTNITLNGHAFLDVKKSTIKGLSELGIDGLLGLSFNVLSASPINDAVQTAYGSQATWGHSVLQNIFDQHPDEPNFVAIDLARTDDLEDVAGGSFAIGEYDERYASVVNAPKLPQYPKGGDRWTTLLEGVKVDGVDVALKSKLQGVPAGRLLALLDTGDPTAIMPTYLLDAIFSKVPGAVSVKSEGVWVVPCNTTTSVSFVFGGEEFPIHPLDLTRIIDDISVGDDAYSACISAFHGADEWGAGYEISLGGSFLRNVYSVYDFGDLPSGEPYMQLLAQTNPAKAAAQVPTMRLKKMSNLPPEIDALTLHQMFGDEVDSTAGGAEPADRASATDASLPKVTGDSESAEGGQLTLATPVGGYGIAIIALLSANLIVTLIVAVIAILIYVRRGRGGSAPAMRSSKNGSYAPVQPDEESGTNKHRYH